MRSVAGTPPQDLRRERLRLEAAGEINANSRVTERTVRRWWQTWQRIWTRGAVRTRW